MEAVTQSEYESLKAWLESEPAGVPPPLRLILSRLMIQYLWLLKTATRAKDTLQTLRCAMGFIPSSERGAQLLAGSEPLVSLPPADAADPIIDELRRRKEHAARQAAYYAGRLRKRLAERARHQPSRSPPPPAAEDAALAQPAEQMFTSAVSDNATAGELERVNRARDFKVQKGLHSSYDHVTRVNLEVKITKIDLRVESLTDMQTAQHVRANLDHIGPAGQQLTWKAIANLVKMVVGFAIPINRVALMLGSPHFTPAKIYRVLAYAAQLALPVYGHLLKALAGCDLLAGDDTTTKVLQTDDRPATPPSAATTEKQSKPPSLHQTLDKIFGWVQPLASGKGPKTLLQVSLVMGRTTADPRSMVALFRTHFGSVGNIITRILAYRREDQGPVTIQGDLASTNLPSPEQRQRIGIRVVGCAAHARRPFWRWRKDDESLSYYMLRGFLMLAEIEEKIDRLGRTHAAVLRLRGKYGRWIWEALRHRAQAGMSGVAPTPACLPAKYGVKPIRWPPDHKLYAACAYIVNHYEALTAYLSDPRLEATNNRRERGLRAEQAMLVSSKFRRTRNGRAVLDVLRTINATCTMAGIDVGTYLCRLYAAGSDVEANPHRYTPYALAVATNEGNADKR